MPNKLSNILFNTAGLMRSVGKNLSKEDRDWNALLKDWSQKDREKKFRTNYNDLNKNSIVFDLGGFKGQWASDIFAQYLCSIYIFEPHPIFASDIAKRFEQNEKIKLFQFGLGAKDSTISLATSAESTSMFKKGKDQVPAQLICAKTFLDTNKFKKIDLMKINIEGGEYDLLDHLIEIDWISSIKNIQIQFHNFVPNAEQRMLQIQNELSKTHNVTYSYKFFWENWTLK